MDLNDRKLLLLGLLRVEAMYGYQLNQFLEEHLDFLTSLKPSTAYYTLDKLAEQGLVVARTEQVGNRPPRQIYEITEAGEAEYLSLLRRNLARYVPGESGNNIGIGFIADLPTGEAGQLLDQKRRAARERLLQLQAMVDRIDSSDAMHLPLTHAVRQLEVDLEWLDQVEAWLMRQAK